MSGNRDSGYNGGKARESGRYGRTGYGTDPSLYSYNSPLRQAADSPPSRRRSYLSEREDRPRSRFDDQPRRYDDPPKRYEGRFRRPFEDRSNSRDYDDRPRSRDFEDRPRSRDVEERPRSTYSYGSDSSGSAPGTLSSSLRSRKARDDPEKSFCAMAGDYLRPNDYEGRNVNPRFKEDYSSMRKQRNAAADDLVKAVLARDALEQDFVRRPKYSTEAHGTDSPPEERSLHENMPFKSGLVLGRPLFRDDRPYDSLPAMHHNWERKQNPVMRSASYDEPISPEGSITPTPGMYRSLSPQSSVSSMSSYSAGPYTYCETPPPGVPPPPAYERRFLDGVLCSPTSSMPSTPSGSVPTTPTGTMPPTSRGSRPQENPLGRSNSTPTSPNYEPGAPHFDTAKTDDRKQEYDDRTTRSESGAPRKGKKGSRKGLIGVFDSDWSDTGSLLREVLDRSLGKSLFEDEVDHDEAWKKDHQDGKSHTREKTINLGDGGTCHVKETRSVGSPDRDRNMFDKYRFKFGSFGSFDDDDDDDKGRERGKDTVEFVDFDDLVRKLKEKPNLASPFNSLRKSPIRKSPVPEEKRKQNYYPDRRPSKESNKSEKAENESILESDKNEASDESSTRSGQEGKASSELKNGGSKERKSPKEHQDKVKEESEKDNEKKPSPKEEKKKKAGRPIHRDDTSPPIDLVSQENEKKKKEAERSPPLGRSKVAIPLPYKKLKKESDHDCDETHYNHTADCPKDCRLTCHHKCRPNVALDCNSIAQEDLEESSSSRNPQKTSIKRRQSGRADDADSGYHTGESTLRDHTPGELTLTREELRKNIDAFNDNQHGLIMTLHEETATFQGFIRVHMNLMRPISMSLPSRPTSIYDVVGSDCESDEPPCETLTTSFYLPKDTTKVIHISSATTTQDVIKALLQKFKITDNPRKFALYEKTENEGAKATMRRLLDEEKPLHLCLSWTAEGLESHRYILQENEPGEIVWEAFSIPELENFLKILDREEDEYVDQMKAKYKLLGIQIERQMKTLVAESEEESQSAACMAGPPGGSQTSFEGDSREPVYV